MVISLLKILLFTGKISYVVYKSLKKSYDSGYKNPVFIAVSLGTDLIRM